MRPTFIQIQGWLRHPEVWRFLGFISTIVGLLSYALSSSFNSLLGNWNFIKLFGYLVLSIIICLASLFAKAWQQSPSLRFRAHVAFLVLTITSIYSFFFDKAVNGKPDAYSVVSCVAFAIMSLSLSRQIHCGFEVDLLYFFLGALIVQLMKIHKFLAVAGACFSYSVVILRSSLDSPLENDYIGLQDQNHVVIELDSHQSNTDSALIMDQFMACIGELRLRNSSLIEKILEHMKSYGEGEAFDGPALGIDHNLVVDMLPRGIIDNLKEAAKSAAAVGLEKEFCDAYSSCRRECLEECLGRLLHLQDVNTESPETLTLTENYTISQWNKALSVALKMLFPSERLLCDRVFSVLSSAANLCFMEICQEAAAQLLNSSSDLFATGNCSLRQILLILVALESLFYDGHTISFTIHKRLREAISISYMETRNAIFHNMELDAPNGGVHPVANKVLIYINNCCRSRKMFEQYIQECLKDVNGVGTSFSMEMVSLLKRLERELKSMSKNYEDPALRSFFMMNNRRYIENRIKRSNLRIHLSDEWVRNNKAKVQRNFELYLRSSWNKVLNNLKLDKESLTVESMKERLYLFNSLFEEMCIVQSTWFLDDKEFREEIITHLENIMLPAYGNFIGRFHDVLATNAYEYINYGMFDIEARLNGLFRPLRK